jgi:hypothetical protein
LKSIVVVVDKEKYNFEGKDLKVINTSVAGLLIVMDGTEDIAVFQKWDLWRKMPED